MNIIAIQLVLVETKPGLVVMCKYPHGRCNFMIAHTLILLFLATQLTTVSLDYISLEYCNTGILLITYFCGSEVAMKP